MSSQSPFSTTTFPLGTCTWPLHPISQIRDLDLTQCFEHAILLPVPLVLAIIGGSAQIFSKSRRLKRGKENGGSAWFTRGERGERIGRIKLVLIFV